jgi:2-iminobutanoate/2-iminopropanoate deaminase
MKKSISTGDAPSAIGPYSQATLYGNLIFTSGQIALKPDGTLLNGDVKEQTKLVLTNLANVLKEAGSSLDNTIKTTIFLADMDDFLEVNTIYATFFTKPYPSRSTVEVKRLPKDVKVEIELIAYLDESYSF